MKIVVLSPHRDDAAFSLGLSIDAWLHAGYEVQVLNCFTQSAYAPYSDVESLHVNDRVSFVSAVRRREDIAWNKMVNNRLQFHDLDLLDAPLRLNCSLEDLGGIDIRVGDRALARVAGAVAKLTRNADPASTAVIVPLAVGSHIDHRVTRHAALETLGSSALPLAFYEDLPYAARASEADRLPECAARTNLGLETTFASPASGDPSLQIRRKLRVAECYDSQVDSEVVRMIAEFASHYGGRERLWANSIWRSSALAMPEDPEQS